MSVRIKVGVVIGVAVLAITATACSSSKSSNSNAGTSGGGSSGLPATVKIGVPLDLTGSAQITGVGTGEQAGVKFAVDQINSSHFLGNTKIEAVYYDTQAAKTQAVARTTQLTTQDKVSAIVGYSLTPSFQAAAPIAQAAKIPTIAVGLSGANANVTAMGNYLFRELLDYTLLFKTGDPEFVKATKGTTAAYIYGSDTVTTSSQEKARKAAMEALGVKTVDEESITASTTSLAAQLTKIKSSNPNYVVVDVDTGQVPAVLTQIGQSGITAQLLGDNGFTSAATLASPSAAKAVQCGLFTVPWYVDSTQGANAQFVKDWEAANGGKAPDMFNALGRDAMWGMASAIKQAGSTDGTAIRAALANLTTPISGALGTYKWASDGQPTYGGVPQQIVAGKPVVWTPSSTCTK
jgi:branched-chain amino acid transport system substrate-binding protein